MARKLLVKEHVSHAVLGCNVVMQFAVEEPGRSLQVSVESLVLSRQVIVLFFVHFFIDDVLLSNAQGTSCSLLVDLRCSTRRLNARLQTAVTPSRRGNVGTD